VLAAEALDAEIHTVRPYGRHPGTVAQAWDKKLLIDMVLTDTRCRS
jgi:hypothetical protein